MVEEILTPEVIATIIGLAMLLGGGTAAGIVVGLRKWLIKGRDGLSLLIDALEDGQLTPQEIKDIMEYLKLVARDPQNAKAKLNDRNNN